MSSNLTRSTSPAMRDQLTLEMLRHFSRNWGFLQRLAGGRIRRGSNPLSSTIKCTLKFNENEGESRSFIPIGMNDWDYSQIDV